MTTDVEKRMRLGLEKFSYRSGSLRLNLKSAIQKEIDEVLIQPEADVPKLTRDQFVEILREEFIARGWESQPVCFDSTGLRCSANISLSRPMNF